MVLLMLDDDEIPCNVQQNPLEVGIGVFIALGLLVSYLPQHYRIIRNKSSEGISPWFLLLGALSGTSSLYNIIILQYHMMECCREVSGGQCFTNTLGIIQLGLQWSMFTLILVLYILYFPEHRKLTPYIPHLHYGSPPQTRSVEWRISLGVAMFVAAHFLLVTWVSVYLVLSLGPKDWGTILWADLLGVVSMVLASVQYLPQIWRTWRRKAVGALSIPMMLMQTPGSFLFVYSLAIRPGTNWTSWIVFLVTGCLQGILLTMCIAWHFRARRLGYGPFYVGDTESLINRDGQPLQTDGISERTGLLTPANTRNNSYTGNETAQ